MTTADQVKRALQHLADPQKQTDFQRFFKTGPGEYGEGDVFLGLTMPQQRSVAKQFFHQASMDDIRDLLETEIHEYRMSALVMLTYQYPKADEQKKQAIFDFYLDHTQWINNWDLVDLSAPNIVGEYMIETKLDMKKLQSLAKSSLLWERRISIVSTLAFIRAVKRQRVDQTWLQPTIVLSELLLSDTHDLIHKAVGWALRELGKVDEQLLPEFLELHLRQMPRTALRYAIERFPESRRKQLLKKSR